MARSAFDRLWNRLVNRYTQDSDADCCGPRIEEVQSDSSKADGDGCCE